MDQWEITQDGAISKPHPENTAEFRNLSTDPEIMDQLEITQDDAIFEPQPENIAEFRNLSTDPDNVIIPEVPEKRKPTDVNMLIALGVCLLVFIPFLIYTCVNADMDRFIYGYDTCGNICGRENSKVDGIPCSGEDKTSLPLLSYMWDEEAIYLLEESESKSEFDDDLLIPDQCVSECNNSFYQILESCIPKRDDINLEEIKQIFTDITTELNNSAGYIILLCFIGLGFCIGTLFLFRYFVAAIVWVIIIGSLVGVIGLTIVFWCMTSYDKDAKFLAIVFTIISIIVVTVLICVFKRIKLTIRLFEEAMNVVFGIPFILVPPFLTLAAKIVFYIIFFYFLILMSTAGFLEQVQPNLYDYYPNGTIIFTIFYHVILGLWLHQFIVGCHTMVISGAVASYYFAWDKSSVVSPISTSFYNLRKYHLGTVAFGSLIMTAFAVLKALIKCLVKNKHAKILIDCCLGAIEGLLKYLTKNAYIQTAIHGQPLYKSGQRAVKLLAANALSAIVVNSVGNFVLGMAKMLIIVCTVIVGILMDDQSNPHFWAILLSGLVTAVIADCFFRVIDTTVDTLFICFCEDSCLNDGMERPYYMTMNFMQYIEEAKKIKGEKK